MHTCDNPICVNPSHVVIGTSKLNRQDCVAKRRDNPAFGKNNGTHTHREKYQGENNGRAKLTNEDVLEIRRLHANGMSHRSIAKKYGMAKSPIGDLLRGKTWKNVAKEIE